MLDIKNSSQAANKGSNTAGWISAGIGAATGIAGMIGQKKREQRAMNNQKELMDKQYENQRALNQQGYDNQMQFWKDTNAPAQMAMLKEAGLNPALMYGQGGAGGSTGAGSGGSAASGSAPSPQPMELGTAIAAARTASELAALKASTRKINAEAEGKEIDNEIERTGGKDRRKLENTNKYLEETGKYNAYQQNSEQYTQKAQAEIEKVNLDTEIAELVKKGMLSDNQVKEYKAKLAKAGIDPDSNPVIREMMKAMAGAGMPLNEMLVKAVKWFID